MPQSQQEAIDEKVHALLLKEETHPTAEKLLVLWTTNYRFTSDQLSASLRSLLLVALVFTLLATANVSEPSLFGLKFGRPDPPLLLSYLVAGFLFYRVITLFTFSQVIESAIRAVYYRLYQNWQVAGLTDLTDYPSFTQIENALTNIEDTASFFKKTASVFVYPVMIAGLLGGLAWFGWGAYVLIHHRLAPLSWSFAAVALNAVLIARALVALVQGGLRA